MSVLKIVTIGNPLLKKKSKAISKVTPEIRKLVKDMTETMYLNKGCGLAAVQVGHSLRLVLIDVSDDKSGLMVLINPKIISRSGHITWTEGCLSVPGLEGKVIRDKHIVVKAKDINFTDFELEAEDYEAVAIQHELDHLEGVLYVERAKPESIKPVNETHEIS